MVVMKWLYLILLIPMSGFAAPTSCPDYAKYLQMVELDLMKTRSPDCKDRPDQTDVLACSTLADLELQMATLQNKRALLEGMESLKTKIQTAKTEIATLPVPKARTAALSFGSAVEIARSLELLANTDNEGKDFLPELRAAILDGRINNRSFISKVALLCNAHKAVEGKVDVCTNRNFQPSQEAVDEMVEVLRNNEMSKETITLWRNSLKIQKDGEDGKPVDYSFNEMSQSIGDLSKGVSSEQIAAIKALPDFKNAPESLDVLKIIGRDKTKIAVANEFKGHIQQLKDRQQMQIQSKMSSAFMMYKSSFTPALLNEDCANAKSDFDSASRCAEAMKSARATMTNDNDKGDLDRLMKSFDNTKNYFDNISSKTANCMEDIEAAMNPANGTAMTLQACASIISVDLAGINSDIKQIQDKIDSLSNSPLYRDLQTIRDYAVTKVRESCATESEIAKTELNYCDSAATDSMPAALQSITSSAMQISILLSKPVDLKDTSLTDNICRNEDRKKSNVGITHICDLIDAGDSEPVVDSPKAKPLMTPSMFRNLEPETKRPDPFWAGISAGLPGLAQQMAQNNIAMMYAQQYNPYGMGYYPTMSSYPNYSSVPAYYLYSGLNYQPTPGLTTYSSFLPGVSSYTPAAPSTLGSSSSFFNFSY